MSGRKFWDGENKSKPPGGQVNRRSPVGRPKKPRVTVEEYVEQYVPSASPAPVQSPIVSPSVPSAAVDVSLCDSIIHRILQNPGSLHGRTPRMVTHSIRQMIYEGCSEMIVQHHAPLQWYPSGHVFLCCSVVLWRRAGLMGISGMWLRPDTGDRGQQDYTLGVSQLIDDWRLRWFIGTPHAPVQFGLDNRYSMGIRFEGRVPQGDLEISFTGVEV